MSLQYNDTDNFKGIVQIYEKEIGANRGDISGNTNKLKDFTVDANLALDDFTTIAIQASGKWQWDDSNHSKHPIIRTDLVQGQQDYIFLADQQGNLVLDIYKVMAKDENGTLREIYPVDMQSDPGVDSMVDGLEFEGVPVRYDKTGNGIFLKEIPSYASVGGLEIYINREASYFVYTDTTKKPGIPGIFHSYIALKPALDYIRRHGTNDAFTKLFGALALMKEDIEVYFGRRQKDTRKIIKPFISSFK